MTSAIDRLMDQVEWIALDHDPFIHDDHIPYATHEGWMDLSGLKLHVYQLNTGMRVIDEESLQRFFRWLGGESV